MSRHASGFTRLCPIRVFLIGCSHLRLFAMHSVPDGLGWFYFDLAHRPAVRPLTDCQSVTRTACHSTSRPRYLRAEAVAGLHDPRG